MKILNVLLSRNISYLILPTITFVFLYTLSCKKEEKSLIDYELQTVRVLYFPYKNISVTFDITPKGNYGPFVLNWYNPDSLNEAGPNTIVLANDLLLDFEITDAKNISQRFTHKLMADSFDSLQYDYRSNLTGTYDCMVSYSFNGSLKYYRDTLTVVKKSDFKMLNIQGNEMRFNKIYHNDSAITFYGYHSGASFWNDSIHYTASGPLGFYYTSI